MRGSRFLIAGAVVAMLGSATLWAAEIDLKDVQCIVAPRGANVEKSADYREGKVFFCCGNCQAKYTAEPKKYATKANHQLVATHQFEQKACPLSGKPVDASQKSKVSGVEVAFCCGNCKGEVDKASAEKQVEMVFADKPFEQAFAKTAKK